MARPLVAMTCSHQNRTLCLDGVRDRIDVVEINDKPDIKNKATLRFIFLVFLHFLLSETTATWNFPLQLLFIWFLS